MTASSIYTDGTYIKHNPTLDSEHSPWKARHIADMLNKCKVSFDSVCEIGCGGGQILSELATSYFTDKTFHGYDISPDAIAVCQKLSKENLSFTVGSVEDIAERYGLVLCIDVFEHVENDFDFLRKLKGIGKYKIFHIPLEIAVWNVIKYRSFLN
ncbi:MAG: class I SAM-dependent methyltransferase, partial [Sedimentisphaerales bacterium]|nr:class I SAM-dependent methyltransferase [Sedimentisphaerales bacterium]